MKFIISGKHLDLTEAIKNYAEEKLSKVEKYTEDINKIDVQIEVEKTKTEGTLHKASATLYILGKTIRIEEIDKDMYTAIDLLADKLTRQVRKHLEKKQNK
ncbi:ribosome hibernation-promoting factor, HPF/YfiA family [Oceanivirga salmonicida]|uniref:ribosome hibernation-promoting factor, HPF/YfiA family n=1 Tax=Oceanivirga salmonicida TaxID=1769291 RepID=UPI0012E12513|nr:ribosome-associated translation inhibitor RaiA [Oceanivirga salmonicida]